jgi:nucleotide-binding universal stress UspA family protein
MPFKTLLTITNPELSNRDLRLTAQLCEEIGAHMSVFVAALAAPSPIGAYAAMASDIWLQQRQEDIDQLKARTAAVTEFLASAALSSDIADDYLEETWAEYAIGRRARYVDLTIVGPEMFSRETLKEKVLEAALFLSGKPMLLVPDGSKPTLKPRCVMVAWDSGMEASRAVRESIEMLAGADEVHVVLVDPAEAESGHGAEPGADIAAYLARHGAKVTVDRLPSQGESVATVLSSHASDRGAELLVMGAYGHSRLRERIFGGTTRSMLEDPRLPILMAR